MFDAQKWIESVIYVANYISIRLFSIGLTVLLMYLIAPAYYINQAVAAGDKFQELLAQMAPSISWMSGIWESMKPYLSILLFVAVISLLHFHFVLLRRLGNTVPIVFYLKARGLDDLHWLAANVWRFYKRRLDVGAFQQLIMFKSEEFRRNNKLFFIGEDWFPVYKGYAVLSILLFLLPPTNHNRISFIGLMELVVGFFAISLVCAFVYARRFAQNEIYSYRIALGQLLTEAKEDPTPSPTTDEWPTPDKLPKYELIPWADFELAFGYQTIGSVSFWKLRNYLHSRKQNREREKSERP